MSLFNNEQLEKIKKYNAKFNEDYFIELANTQVSNMMEFSFKNFDKKLFDVSIPYYEIKISSDEIQFLLVNQTALNENPKLYDSLGFFYDLKKLIENKFGNQKFFAKYFTRSAKDVGEPIYKDAYEMMDCMINSMRVFEDMCLTYRTSEHKDELVIYLRPFIEFDKKDEYRLFYVNGFYSVCNYHKQDGYELNKSNEIDEDLLKWVEENINPYIRYKDYCMDFIKKNDEFLLIEFNPWFLSDPIFLNSEDIPTKHTQLTY